MSKHAVKTEPKKIPPKSMTAEREPDEFEEAEKTEDEAEFEETTDEAYEDSAQHTNGKAGKVHAPKTTNLATKKEQTLTPEQHDEMTNVVQGDLLIPRVLLMQAMSDLVKQRKAFPGQIVKSPEGKVLGGISEPGKPSTPIEVIPLAMKQTWTITSATGNKWIGSEERTNANDHLPWQFTNENGEDCKRVKTVELLCLLASDVESALPVKLEDGEERPEIPESIDDAVLLPVAFSFRSSSFKAGQGVATFFEKVRASMKTYPLVRPFHYTMQISCSEESNDSGDYFVFQMGPSKKTEVKYLKDAKHWYETLQKKKIAVESESASEQTVAKNVKSRPSKEDNF